MPEGPQIHGHARRQRQLVDQTFRVHSPQGRFDQAMALDGRRLAGVEAWGKHLLYRFERAGRPPRFWHVHLGLHGSFRLRRGTPRLEEPARALLIGEDHTLELHRPLRCEVLPESGARAAVERLGPDPLRIDHDRDAAIAALLAHPACVGLALMDQTMWAGVGNIYRTELLYRAGIHPLAPAGALDAQVAGALWDDTVHLFRLCMQRGLVTVEQAPGSHKRWVYRRPACLRCGSRVERLRLDGRDAFACPRCQSGERAP